MNLLRWLLTATPPKEPIGSIDELFERVRREVPFSGGIALAAAAGKVADRPGYAFACGYAAALTRLVPTIAFDDRACLCATEKGGAHPKAIEARLDSGTLSGTKTFVTLATHARTLLVVARSGEGEKNLVVVKLPAGREGIAMRERPPLPIAPEIPHCEVDLVDVKVAPGEVLPGDGYDAYVKPFRTIEDMFVLAAILGWGTKVARERAWIEEALGAIVALAALAPEDPSDPALHVALAGVLGTVRRLLRDTGWIADDATQQMWSRDFALLQVAENARNRRLESAWARLTP